MTSFFRDLIGRLIGDLIGRDSPDWSALDSLPTGVFDCLFN